MDSTTAPQKARALIPSERNVLCPKCGFNRTKTLDSRFARFKWSIRRRRQCWQCKHRWSTYERIASAEDETEEMKMRATIRNQETAIRTLCSMVMDFSEAPSVVNGTEEHLAAPGKQA